MGEAADHLLDFLERAALDGHTVVPVEVAGSILTSRALRLEEALRDLGPDGRSLVISAQGVLGLRRLVEAERAVASAVSARVPGGTVAVVAGPAGSDRDELAASLGGPRPAVLDDAERLDVETVAAFFADAADDETVVLVGDLDELGSFGPGRVFADVVDSGLAAMRSVLVEPSSVLDHFAAAIRAGELSVPDDPARGVVVLQVGSSAEAAHRVGQLLATSIPRALAIPAADVQVLTVSDGAVETLRETVADAGGPCPLTIGLAAGRSYPAVVLVLEPSDSGVLSRQLVYSGVRRAERHLSIVNATGAALADAVRHSLARPRRTLLPGLLAAQLSSGSHSRSSSSDSSSASSSPSTGPNGVTSS
jgi:hypothetical protein